MALGYRTGALGRSWASFVTKVAQTCDKSVKDLQTQLD
jgi:hypothetical protein